MGSNGDSLKFGVELELLLGGRKKAFTSWKAMAEDVSKRLLKAGIRNHVQTSKSKTAETYREWSIVQEVTIPNGDNLWGIELVSPVYPAAWSWAADIATIFATVHAAYAVVSSAHCSTHVHVSGAPRPLSDGGVVLLGEAVLYFEHALDGLMPTARRGSTTYWCRSNRESQMFQEAAIDPADRSVLSGVPSPDLPSCLGVVRYGHDAAAYSVPEAVNLLPPDCAYGRAHGKKRPFVHGKVFKWNFGHLQKEGDLGTVEYRQPPGSVVAEDACAWVTLTLAFVAGVTAGAEYNGGVFPPAAVRAGDQYGASLADLWQVLQAGAAALGWADLGGVAELFRASSSGSDSDN